MSEYYTNVAMHGQNLLVRGIRDGQEFRSKIKYSPTLYIQSAKQTGYTDIYGNSLKPLQFDTMVEARNFVKQNEETNLKVYGFPFYNSQYCIETYPNAENDWKREEIRVFTIDIEVSSEEGFPEPDESKYPITAICVHDSLRDKFITFGNGDWSKNESVLPEELVDKVFYVPCNSERQILEFFLKYWCDNIPQIVTGWNTQTFDMPYVHNRMVKLGFDVKRLSPWGVTRLREFPTKQGTQQRVEIVGVDDIDYLDRYKKNAVQESYRLDHIANIELGEKKLDYEEAGTLHRLFFDDFNKFIDYNIQDTNLVKRLDDKMGLIDVQIAVAYKAGINYEDVSGVVKTWDALINREMAVENKIPPSTFPKYSLTEAIPGGYVKQPQVGKHGWVASFDLNSLYPHLIMQYNISPETIMDKLQVWPDISEDKRMRDFLHNKSFKNPGDFAVAASGWCFKKDHEGMIPRAMRKLYSERKKIQGIMKQAQKDGKDITKLHLAQYVRKILLNSGYGAITNKYYRWFDPRLGSSITLSGQFVIQRAEMAINRYLNKLLKTDKVDYVIAIDTDSNYVNLQPLVDKFFADKSKAEVVDILDRVCEEQLTKALNQEFDEIAKYQNVYEQKMVMGRENIADSAFWTAKKRYAMNVWDIEGYRPEKPKLKIQGLEAIRSSTPQICREPLLKLIELCLVSDEAEVQKAVQDLKKYFLTLRGEDIAFPRTMNNVWAYTPRDNIGFKKGTPPHIRGAVLFNRLIKQHKLENTWEFINNGEKGKFLWLREPNNVGSDVISYMTAIPNEFKVRDYIDYQKMFQKIIIEPMEGILDPIGWSIEKKLTLTNFFE